MASASRKHRNAGARLDGMRRQMPPIGARAGHRVKGAEQMPGDGVQPHAASAVRARYRDRAPRSRPSSSGAALPRRTASDRPRASATAPDRRRGPSSRRRHAQDARAPPRRVPMPPLMTIGKSRMRALSRYTQLVVERRDVAILARRQSVEPGLARVHDQRVDAGRAPPRR